MLEAAGRLCRTTTMLPSPAPGEILVATTIGAVSPGAERSLLHGTCPSVPAGAYPCQPGHLNVVTIRDAHDRTLIHERGIATLGHRDHALIPYQRFIRIPPGVSDEAALLGVLAADTRNAIEIATVDAAADCLVVGGGVMGALTAWELCERTRGAVRIVERDAARRELLGRIRFPREVVVDESAGRQLFDTIFDCASTASAFRIAQQSARPRGSIVLIADGSHEQYVLAPEFFAKGLYLGKTDSNPDLRGFLGEFFARREDRSSLIEVAFRQEIRFADFPQAYLEALLAPSGGGGLLPRVRYGD
jgi:threonine dehydrogenase-like Zn-dependent dehydrogenase